MANGGPWLRGLLSALVTVVAVAAVGLGVFAWDRFAGDGRSATIPVGTAEPRAPSDCPRAQPTLFAALSAHLASRGDEFGPAQYAAKGDAGLTYLTAPVGNSAGVRATDPVWVYGAAGYAWLNESARRTSSGLPDARVVYGADPAGPEASTILSCATSGGS